MATQYIKLQLPDGSGLSGVKVNWGESVSDSSNLQARRSGTTGSDGRTGHTIDGNDGHSTGLIAAISLPEPYIFTATGTSYKEFGFGLGGGELIINIEDISAIPPPINPLRIFIADHEVIDGDFINVHLTLENQQAAPAPILIGLSVGSFSSGVFYDLPLTSVDLPPFSSTSQTLAIQKPNDSTATDLWITTKLGANDPFIQEVRLMGVISQAGTDPVIPPNDIESYMLEIKAPKVITSGIVPVFLQKAKDFLNKYTNYSIESAQAVGSTLLVKFSKPSNPLAISTVVIVLVSIISLLLFTKMISYTLTRTSDNNRIIEQEETDQTLLDSVKEAHLNGVIGDEEYNAFLNWFQAQREDDDDNGGGFFDIDFNKIMWAMVAVSLIGTLRK